ncbi:hypothetical protein K2P47_04195 [Patescibacteria group bacterium]|nr:hypothetical protein [Patescibacteria group bacterium]
MTSTITKISIVTLFITMFFIAIVAFAGTASAQVSGGGGTGCSGCGGGGGTGTPGGSYNGGGGGGEQHTPVTPTCDLTISKLEVTAIGEAYRVTWAGGPASASFFINGSAVADSGAANFTFTGPNYDRFKMVGNNGGVTCEKEVRVIKKVVEIPRCESFTATPGTLPAGGGSVTLRWDTTNATNATLDGQTVAGDGSLTVNVTANKTFTLNLSNSAGQASCSAPVTVTPPTPVHPICDSFTANPTSIVRGDSATLTWATTNATEVSINNGIGGVAVDGTRVVTPTNTITYILTATRDGKSVTCPVTVTVNDAPTPVHPICDSFTSNPASIVRGNSATLNWATTNADSVSIDNGIGGVAVDGTRVVSPTNTTNYILTATKEGKSVTCYVKVTVTDVPTPLHPVCDSFSSNPTTINRGQSSQLTWNTTNADSVTINNAIGTVAVDGNISVSPLQTITYILTATKDAKSVTCPVTITVNQPDAPITCAANVDFTASSYSIREGNNSTLTWNTTGIDSVRINGVNSTALDGSETVSPRSDTAYTLTATKGNDSVNCPLTINVDEDNGGGGGGGGSSAPKCTLKISDNKISLGERITIKWDTTRATEITLKDNHGKTLVDTDDKSSSEKKDLYDGEITLRPEKDTTYTLVAEKGSRDKTCKVSVDVEDTVVVTQVRDQQPLVTGIALTEVPYTGFEAGSFMTSVFYTLLAAWALYMAYVLVGRRNSMNTSAFTPAMVTADIVPETTLFPEKVTAAPAFYQAPVAAPVVNKTIGYEAHTDLSATLEAQAHAAHVLVSADALAYFIAATADEDRAQILSGVLAAAKASYPSEGGWVTITADRMVELASKN